MARSLPTLLPADLELRLLRKGVGELTAERQACADCGRTPLIGETIHRHGKRTFCTLCSGRRGDTPDRSHVVRHMEHGHAVKLRAA